MPLCGACALTNKGPRTCPSPLWLPPELQSHTRLVDFTYSGTRLRRILPGSTERQKTSTERYRGCGVPPDIPIRRTDDSVSNHDSVKTLRPPSRTVESPGKRRTCQPGSLRPGNPERLVGEITQRENSNTSPPIKAHIIL